jgi:plastocyanin
MFWKLLAVTLLTIGLTAAVACGDDDDGDDAADEPTPAETTPADSETDIPTDEPAPTTTGVPSGTEEPDDGQPLTFGLSAADFSFNRSTISAPAGTEVTVDFENVGSAPHTFTVDSLDINEQLGSGEGTTLTFTMPDTETEFYCAIHPSLMTGTLVPLGDDQAAAPSDDGSGAAPARGIGY